MPNIYPESTLESMTVERPPGPTFLKLPIRYNTEESSRRMALGLPYDNSEYEPGFTYINQAHITAFVPVQTETEDAVKVWTIDGDRYWIYLPISQFLAMLGPTIIQQQEGDIPPEE